MLICFHTHITCEVIRRGGPTNKRRINSMTGTKAGGKLAAKKNLAKDPNFYAKIGAKGGRNGHTGGFAANPDLARVAGAKGGRISRRKKSTVSAE